MLVSGGISSLSLLNMCHAVIGTRQAVIVCPLHQLCCFTYLARLHLSLLLAAMSAVGQQLVEAELPEQVTGAAQQVAGEAQLPACLRRQLGTIRRQLEREDSRGTISMHKL